VPGYSHPFVVCYTWVNIHTDFFGYGGAGYSNLLNCDPSQGCNYVYNLNETITGWPAIQSIKLPDGRSWKFAYDSAPDNDNTTIAYGLLKRLVLPTGGAISYCFELENTPLRSQNYDYGPTAVVPYATRRIETQTDTNIDCNNPSSPGWQFSFNLVTGAPNYTVTETDPAGNDTVHTFPEVIWRNAPRIYEGSQNEIARDYYSGSAATGNKAKHIDFHFDIQQLPGTPTAPNGEEPSPPANWLPSGQDTYIDGGLTSSTSLSYPSTFIPITYLCSYDSWYNTNSCVSLTNPSAVSLGIPTSSTAGDQTTVTQYKWQTDQSYVTANRLDSVASVTVSDATSSQETDYGYNDSGYVAAGLGPGHLTSITRVNDSGPNPITHIGYGSYGMVTAVVDANNTTTNQVISWDGQHLFPTISASPLGQEQWSYDDDSGRLLKHTDLDSQSITYTYDVAGRPQSIQYPDSPTGASQYFCYPDANTAVKYQAQSTSVAAPTSCGQAQGNAVVTKAIADGLGRVTDNIVATGSDSIAYKFEYDSLGRVYQQSYPYGNGQTPSFSTTHYDAIGRIYQIDYPDGSNRKSTHNGLTTTSTDESGHSIQTVSDLLGRISHSREPNKEDGSLSVETDYSYNVHGLSSVSQLGESGESPRVQRSFSYNALSQLIQSYNPESGWICYGTTGGNAPDGTNCTPGYDLNGNLQYKTDARGVTASYIYDLSNRLRAKVYSGGLTSASSACYLYDSETNSGSNTKGRLVGEWTQPGTCDPNATGIPSSAVTWRDGISYDAMGRIASETQCAFAPCSSPSSLQYMYDLAGNLTYTNNGLANSQSPQFGWTNSYDDVGRLSKIVSNWADAAHPETLFQADATAATALGVSNAYSPFGGFTAAWYGLNSMTNTVALTDVRAYDNRARLIGKTVLGMSSVTSTPTTTKVSLNSPISDQGSQIVITVHADCNSACGQVDLLIDSVDLGPQTLDASGNVTVPSTALPGSALTAVTHSVVASYLGDSSHTPSSGTTSYTIQSSSQFVTVSMTNQTLTPGETSTIRVHVNCSSCGEVYLTVDGVYWFPFDVDSNGDYYLDSWQWAVASPNFNSPGTHTLVAHYLGNSTYAAADSDSVQFTMQPPGSQQIKPMLSMTAQAFTTSEDSDISIHHNCNAACGYVTLTVDNNYWIRLQLDANGNASIGTFWWWTPYFTVGNHTLVAHYLGNATYAPVDSDPVNFTIQEVGTQPMTVTFSMTPQIFTPSYPATASVHLGCNAKCGMVEITIDGNVWFAWGPGPDLQANGDLIIDTYHWPSGYFTPGTHTVQAVFLGNATYARSPSDPVTVEFEYDYK
jgi:YD repeat-containing protein